MTCNELLNNMYRNELIQQEKDNYSLIGLLMVYRTFDSSIHIPVNVRLKDMFAFEVHRHT